jgi:hypothetical protein
MSMCIHTVFIKHTNFHYNQGETPPPPVSTLVLHS